MSQVLVTSDESGKVMTQPSGGRLFNDAGKSFTMKDALITSAGYGKKDDSMPDTMRLYRLGEKIRNSNGLITLTETDIDDLKERGHLLHKERPWIFGPLMELLERTTPEEGEEAIPGDQAGEE